VFHEIVTRSETKSRASLLYILKRRFISNRYSFPYGFATE